MRYTVRYMKKILTILAVCFILFFSSSDVSAQRIAECDACGYCHGRTPPENWGDCAQCIYPTQYVINSDPRGNETLKINEDPAAANFNKPPQPASGKYFTQIGCLNTGLTSFTDASAGGGVLNFLLSYLIFPAVGILAFGVIVYGAFLLVTAQGDQFKIEQGKRMVTSAIVGLIFTFSVVLIVNIIGSDILRIPGLSRSTQITFVGYGTSTFEAGNQVFPNLSVRLDDKEVAVIESIQGSSSNQQSRTVSLPETLDFTNPAELQRIKLVFTNDLCLTRSVPGSCCLSASPGPLCSQPATEYYGDRNIYNYQLLIDGRECTGRRLSNGYPIDANGMLLNAWENVYYICDSLAP